MPQIVLRDLKTPVPALYGLVENICFHTFPVSYTVVAPVSRHEDAVPEHSQMIGFKSGKRHVVYPHPSPA